VFEFTGTSLDQKATSTAPDGQVNSVAWLQGTKYLAAGGYGTTDFNEIKVFEFTGTTLDQKATSTLPDGDVNSVAWLTTGTTHYLATGGYASTGPNEIKVFAFDPTLPPSLALTQKASSSSPDGDVKSVAWLTDGTKNYLASGGFSPTLKVFEFTGSTLNQSAVTTINSAVYSVAWLTDGTSNYLAAGGVGFPIEINLFKFTGSALIQNAASSAPEDQVNSVAWLTNKGIHYLASGDNASEIKVFIFNPTITQPEQCVITNNMVQNSINLTGTGVGIRADSAVNYVAQNTSCNNDINYQSVAAQYLDSQANARGVDNVDCNLKTPSDTACNATPLVDQNRDGAGFILLDTPGNYCLAMDMTATVSITAPNVCLCLNCRELTGTIEIYAEDVTIKDGTLTAPAPTDNT
ncbi:MAG: hypothetical protein U1E13_01180, partial [Methylophilaceae bacterium]|nr:hypothetical protein [Methylophilaceae bacterium]